MVNLGSRFFFSPYNLKNLDFSFGCGFFFKSRNQFQSGFEFIFLNQELSFGSNSNSKNQTQFQFGFYKPNLQMMVLTFQITQHQYEHGIEIVIKLI
jgi:hypothetical protein